MALDPRSYPTLREYLRACDRTDLEKLMWSWDHQNNVWGFYPGTVGQHASDLYNEIEQRGAARR